MEAFLLLILTMAASTLSYSDAALLCHCTNCQGNLTCITDGACFFKSVEVESSTITELGCLSRHLLTMCDSTPRSFCCNTSLCNNQTHGATTVQIETSSDSGPVQVSEKEHVVHITDSQILQIFIATVAVFVVAAVICMVFPLIICCHRRRGLRRRPNGHSLPSLENPGHCCDRRRWGLSQEAEAIIPKGHSLAQLIEQAQRTTADSHLSTMVQKTVVCRSNVVKHLHSGSFGELYLGKWREDQVAIKIFSERHSDVWYKEVEVYQMPSLQHRHLLHFIAADLKQKATGLEYWLVTEYHERGDLRSYLAENSITLSSAIRYSWSIASGLAELHEFRTQPKKPSIAHCNISSANVLLKSNGECCLSDMNCSVTFGPQQTSSFPVYSSQELRYRPPELIEEPGHSHLSSHGFDAHLRGDVYSLALVLWEICRRCDIHGQFYEAVLPYEEQLPLISSLTDARMLLFVNQHRPSIPELWEDHEVLCFIARVMRDCWSPNFLGRPSSSSVRDMLCFLIKDTVEECRKDNVVKVMTLHVDSESDISSPSSDKPPPSLLKNVPTLS